MHAKLMMSEFTPRDKCLYLKIFILWKSTLSVWYPCVFTLSLCTSCSVSMLVPAIAFVSFQLFLWSFCVSQDALLIVSASTGYCPTIFNPFSWLRLWSLTCWEKKHNNKTWQYLVWSFIFLFCEDSKKTLLSGGRLPNLFIPGLCQQWGVGSSGLP